MSPLWSLETFFNDRATVVYYMETSPKKPNDFHSCLGWAGEMGSTTWWTDSCFLRRHYKPMPDVILILLCEAPWKLCDMRDVNVGIFIIIQVFTNYCLFPLCNRWCICHQSSASKRQCTSWVPSQTVSDFLIKIKHERNISVCAVTLMIRFIALLQINSPFLTSAPPWVSFC